MAQFINKSKRMNRTDEAGLSQMAAKTKLFHKAETAMRRQTLKSRNARDALELAMTCAEQQQHQNFRSRRRQGRRVGGRRLKG